VELDFHHLFGDEINTIVRVNSRPLLAIDVVVDDDDDDEHTHTSARAQSRSSGVTAP